MSILYWAGMAQYAMGGWVLWLMGLPLQSALLFSSISTAIANLQWKEEIHITFQLLGGCPHLTTASAHSCVVNTYIHTYIHPSWSVLYLLYPLPAFNAISLSLPLVKGRKEGRKEERNRSQVATGLACQGLLVIHDSSHYLILLLLLFRMTMGFRSQLCLGIILPTTLLLLFSLLLLLLPCLTLTPTPTKKHCSSEEPGNSYVSAIGDPGMKSPNARFAWEAWDFCNEVGAEAPHMGSPRMADCADLYCPSPSSTPGSLTFYFITQLLPSFL